MRQTHVIASILACTAVANCGGSGSTGGAGGTGTTSGTAATSTGATSTATTTSTTSSTSASTGTGGTGGASFCKPTEMVDCYDGPKGTKGVGVCAAGKKTCDALGQSFGPCKGQVLPAAVDNCAKAVDANCDGMVPAPCTGALGWVDHFGGNNKISERGLAADAAGNLVVVGGFSAPVDFGGGALVSKGADDVFIAKYGATGKHIWSQSFGDASQQDAQAVAIDVIGDVVVLGGYKGTLDFAAGALTAVGPSYNLFLAKFDVTGTNLWSKSFGSDALTDVAALSLAVDGTGNVFITGNFQGALNLGGADLKVSTAMSHAAYLAKLDAGGNHVWSKAFGASNTTADKVAVDASGNVVITGSADAPIDFGGGPLTPVGANDAFVAELDGSGAHKWSKLFGAAGNDVAHGVAVDAAGNVFATGKFNGTVDFGGGAIVANKLDTMFLVQLDGTGKHLWSKGFSSTVTVSANDLAVDAAGNVVASGQLDGTIDFGGGMVTTPSGALAVKFDGSGKHLWSKVATNGGALGIAIDGATNVYLLGDFSGSIDFGAGAVISGAGSDLFLVKLAP